MLEGDWKRKVEVRGVVDEEEEVLVGGVKGVESFR